MHHLFQHAASALVRVMWTLPEIEIVKHAPYAQNLQSLGFIGIDQEGVTHTRTIPARNRARHVEFGSRMGLKRSCERDSMSIQRPVCRIYTTIKLTRTK